MAWIRTPAGALLNAAFLATVEIRGGGDRCFLICVDARGLRHDLAGPVNEAIARELLEKLADDLPLHAANSGIVDLRAPAEGAAASVQDLRLARARRASRGGK